MNQHETPVARTLLDIASSDQTTAIDRLHVYQQYLAINTSQVQRDAGVRGVRGTTWNGYIAQEDPFQRIERPRPVDIERLLSTEGVVLYGSRALNVNRNSSDYDLAFSYESHRSIYEYLRINHTPMSYNTSYFTSVPEAGYHTFFQYIGEDTKIDIIFVHNDEDLDVIRSSIQDLQSIPSYMLHDKHFRIEVYNRALQHRGWKPLVNAPGSERILSRQRRAFEEARSETVTRARGTSIW